MNKYLELKEYKEMWDNLKSNIRIEIPNIDPVMKKMTVFGVSGPGCEFENEYDRMMYNHHNPKMPIYIDMWGIDGCVRYHVKRKKK